MILTEDKTYTISLEHEDCGSTTGLVNKNTELVFSNKELLHAVVTCGMPIQRMTASFLSKKKLELTYKMFLVETALDTEGDRLKKAKRIAYLDSSEKSVMSYYMGMFLTKLISGRLYGADYLTHLNLISSIDQKEFIDFFNSEWRQDMIGLSIPKNQWSVWEAKGGSNRREQALKKGSQQISDIESVNGNVPAPAAVCITYYDHSYLCGVVRQPESDRKEKKECIRFREEDFFRAYYQPLCELFMEQGEGLRLCGKNVEISLTVPYFSETESKEEERRVRVGMPRKLLYCLMENEYENFLQKRSELLDSEYPEDAFVGTDGIYIR